MSEIETPDDVTQGFEQAVRERIDDALDVVENFVASKLAGAPPLIRPVATASANGAFATIRNILRIPDDIGGDED